MTRKFIVITDRDMNVAYNSLPMMSYMDRETMQKLTTRTPLHNFVYLKKLFMIIIIPNTDIKSV